VSGVELRQVPVGQLEPHPRNVRRDVGDLTELAASIAVHGVLEPLVVVEDPDGGDTVDVAPQVYRVLAGHRRLAAAVKAGLSSVPVLVHGDLDDRQQVKVMLAENLQRSDLSPVEEADAYQLLLDLGDTVAKIAKSTGRAKSTVQSRLALRGLDEEVRGRVHAGQVTLADAEVFLEFAGDERATKRLTAALGTVNWQWQAEHLRVERDQARAAAETRARLVAAGWEIAPHDTQAWDERRRAGWELLRDMVDPGTGERPDPPTNPARGWLPVDGQRGVVWWADPAATGLVPYWQHRAGAGTDPAGGEESPRARHAREQREAAAERAREARARLEEDLATAATLRARHLRTVLAQTVPPPGTWEWLVAVLYCNDLETRLAAALTLEFLGLPIPEQQPGQPELTAAARTRTWAALAALAAAAAEETLANPYYADTWREEDLAQYLTWLQASGYTLSEFEQRNIAEHGQGDEPEDDGPGPGADVEDEAL